MRGTPRTRQFGVEHFAYYQELSGGSLRDILKTLVLILDLFESQQPQNSGRRRKYSPFVNWMTWFLSLVGFQEEAWCHFNHWPDNFLLNEHFELTGRQEGLCLLCLETEVKDLLSLALRNKGRACEPALVHEQVLDSGRQINTTCSPKGYKV